MSNWIKNAIKNPGSLHRSLGIPQDQKIPAGKLRRAEHSKDASLKRRAVLASTLGKIRRGPKRSVSY